MTVVSKLENQGRLPAQPEHDNVTTITLRSGKVLPSTTQEPNMNIDPLSSKIQVHVKDDEKSETQGQPSTQKICTTLTFKETRNANGLHLTPLMITTESNHRFTL